ncbi:MAG: ATP-grasp domain-containing protein [Acidobacteria bacterium]|nr:ATP-grasp domain-containing protein [Acidobacteriota bacterium]
MPLFKKILIANRGEIAVRIMRTCREMGIRTVAAYSDADREAVHVRAADEAWRLGPPPATESYLSVERVIEAARSSGAEAIHPGYGFLSENPLLSKACSEAGLVFIGPDPRPMERLGNKLQAREMAREAGLGVLPGTRDAVSGVGEILECGRSWGYPLLLKAAAGGGGRGMRVVRKEGHAAAELRAAQNEAQRAFGNPSVYVERYLEQPRHIEIQVLSDRHGHSLVLGERECSIQRRHQKLIEESPSPAAGRQELEEAGRNAAALCTAAGYAGAATVEFLMDSRGKLTFMEVNTRLQVEHPVTEARFGVDIVEQQIRIAAGEELPEWLTTRRPRGAAIEVRVYAEDPEEYFLPDPGVVKILQLPEGPGVRCDSGIYQGYRVPMEYDPLLVKVITWGRSRPQALARMRRALSECRISGLRTTQPFLAWVLADPEFRAGRYSTGFVAERWDNRSSERKKRRRKSHGRVTEVMPLRVRAALAAVALEVRRYSRATARLSSTSLSSWRRALGHQRDPGGGWSGRGGGG